MSTDTAIKSPPVGKDNKFCRKCWEEKMGSEFFTDNRNQDKLSWKCKKCDNADRKRNLESQRERKTRLVLCNTCNKKRTLNWFDGRTIKNNKYAGRCIPCAKKRTQNRWDQKYNGWEYEEWLILHRNREMPIVIGREHEWNWINAEDIAKQHNPFYGELIFYIDERTALLLPAVCNYAKRIQAFINNKIEADGHVIVGLLNVRQTAGNEGGHTEATTTIHP